MISYKKTLQSWHVLEAENQRDIDDLLTHDGLFVVWNRKTKSLDNVFSFSHENKDDLFSFPFHQSGHSAHERATKKVFVITTQKPFHFHPHNLLKAAKTALTTGKTPKNEDEFKMDAEHILCVWNDFVYDLMKQNQKHTPC